MTFLNLRLDQSIIFEDHFAPRWSAAKNWMGEGWSPYSEETHQATLKLLQENGSSADPVSRGKFLDPAWYVYLYIPISFVPYSIAKAIWMTLLEASVAVSIYLAIQLSGIKLRGLEVFLTITLGALFFPFVRDYLSANMLPFFIMLTLLAVKLAINRQSVQAGFLFLTAFWVNPTAIFVIVFLLLVLGGRRDNGMARILLVGLGFLMVTSLILFPDWIGQWFGSIAVMQPGLDWFDTPWMRIAKVFPGASVQISIFLHLASFVMLLVEWYGLSQRNERSLQWKLMLTLTVSYFFNLYSDGSALLLVFPGLFAIFKYLSEKWPLSGKIIHWIVYLAIGIISWRPVTDLLSGIPETQGVNLLLVPLIIFAGLQWFRWWAIGSPKALVESNKITG